MCEEQVLPTEDALTARSAIWLTCPECDHTTRVLAVMAGRVLRERRQCPKCLSTHAPQMSQTVVGAHIPASEAHHAPASAAETASLRAWIESDGNKHNGQRWFRVLFYRLASRFSRARPARMTARAVPPLHEPALGLAAPKDKL
jgi:hypothetical protein